MESYPVDCIIDKIKEKGKASAVSVCVPGSKSITNRALLLATMAEGESVLEGALFSDDSRHFLSCIKELGFEAEAEEEKGRIRVIGLGGKVPRKEASVYVGSAGTAARFLTAFLALSPGTYHLDASPQMQKRPMDSLLACLKELGAEVTYEKEEGHFPFTLHRAPGQRSGMAEVTVDVQKSSQFLSALLISAGKTGEDVRIHVQGDHGMAYVEMTLRMMEQFGVKIQKEDERTFVCRGTDRYRPLHYRIEPDVSGAGYFYAMCPILGIPVGVPGVYEDSLQGDVKFLHLLAQMGCSLKEEKQGLVLYPPEDGKYHGITADMGTCSDQAITMAAVAVFADSPTTITGIGHIRYQESDRLSAIVTELDRLGIRTEHTEDSLTIYPGKPVPGSVKTYEDHRMAMGFSLIGLRAEGIVIEDPMCCRKTFENYFEVLEKVIHGLFSEK